jgi:hypothetical protein
MGWKRFHYRELRFRSQTECVAYVVLVRLLRAFARHHDHDHGHDEAAFRSVS